MPLPRAHIWYHMPEADDDARLCRHIERQLGYKSHSLGYHTFKSLQELAESTAKDVVQLADGHRRPVYAVTHSMGAIVLRHIMELPNHGTCLF